MRQQTHADRLANELKYKAVLKMARRIVCTRTLRSKILFDGGPYNTIRSFMKRHSSHDSVAGFTAATDGIAGSSQHTQTTHSGFSFDDAESAYQSKTSWEIVRALAIFRLCSYDFLVSKNKEVDSPSLCLLC